MSDRPLVELFDTAILDLDGCTFHGDTALPYVAESLATARGAGMRVFFLTNNSSRTQQQIAEKLTGLGIPTAPEDTFSAAIAGARMVERQLGAGAKVLMLGADGVRQALAGTSLQVVTSADDDPAAVLQGLSHELTWYDLTEAAIAIQRGATYFATNLDAKLPNERGFGLGNGSLAAAVTSATGVRPISAGKPEPEIFRLAVEQSGARRPITVGDQLATDVRGAVAAGLPCLQVLTGVSSARDVILADPAERPSHLGLDMRDLLVPYHGAENDGDWWVCAGEAAAVDRGALHLRSSGNLTDGQPVSLHAYRALAAAAWHASDTGTLLACPDIVVER